MARKKNIVSSPYNLLVLQLTCLCALLLNGCATSPRASRKIPQPAIREFDVSTIEELGRRIYERDLYAARATDTLFEEVGTPERLEEEKIRGWIVQETNKEVLVRFIKQVDENFAPAYDITFASLDKGTLTKATGKLSPDESAQFNARQLALKNIPEFFSPRYNTVVLPDVDGKGFLVYALAATTDPDLVLIGGHYRLTVSQDGTKVEQVDRLFKSFLVLSKSDLPKDGETVGLVASHVVSNTPVETHVFVSLLHNQPLFIVTMDGEMWKTEKGTISRMGSLAIKELKDGKIEGRGKANKKGHPQEVLRR
ncbi:MAG: hypothetical protein ACYS76_06710 [Planctomycetota bacterium]